MWRSIGKGVLNKTIDVKVQAQKCLNFDVNRFVKYSFSYGTSHNVHERFNENAYFKTFESNFQKLITWYQKKMISDVNC